MKKVIADIDIASEMWKPFKTTIPPADTLTESYLIPRSTTFSLNVFSFSEV